MNANLGSILFPATLFAICSSGNVSAAGVCLLYEHWDFTGRVLEMNDGEKIDSFHLLSSPFNDAVSSAKVVLPAGKSRCTLKTYQDAAYLGCRREYHTDNGGAFSRFSKANPAFGVVHIGHLGTECAKDTAPVSSWLKENDNVSSAICSCT